MQPQVFCDWFGGKHRSIAQIFLKFSKTMPMYGTLTYNFFVKLRFRFLIALTKTTKHKNIIRH